MPTYDYECTLCAQRFEIFHGILEDYKSSCPDCNDGELQRIIGKGSGIIFKGSGFYRNDSRSNTKKSKVASQGTEAATSTENTEKSSGTGTDSGASSKPKTVESNASTTASSA